MKRGGVRNAPNISQERLNAAASGAVQPSSAPIVNTLRERVGAIVGNVITLPICGKNVKFTLKTIPGERVEKATMVWAGNERLQELLTETSLDDLIPSFLSSGQQNPAFGREISGVVEVADGSRRRKAAIITGSDYRVLVGDLDDEQMSQFSLLGNEYRPTSAYERGKRYTRLLETKYDNNVSQLADAENIDRKVIMRCVNTAELPIEVISLFTNPTELSARAGEELHKVHESHKAEMMSLVEEFAAYKKAGEKLDTALIIKTLKNAGKEPENERKKEVTVRNFGPGITARYKGDDVDLSFRGVAPDLIKRVESILEAMGKEGGISSDVNQLLGTLEQKLTGKK
ncbi:ParB/RepB/Spo0J family plasmid partition protein [Rouxiella badensis]|uniref:Chromosome partitioning protein ParB n=1 Tax=Rouxiella badensis TaxID=1646377 RepID=A0A1X0WB50_9GAMM|nr:ParB/RepB/Spo0J family plasmid partition protein [Rouxiella badensis]ORJ23971.1 chromosome partitioning protein ParB [Rouxiella badensis]